MNAAESLALTIARFELAAKERGFAVSADLRVSEKDAAILIGYSAAYLKAMRQAGEGPRSYRIGVAGSRVSYRFDDLASWVEVAREETNDR